MLIVRYIEEEASREPDYKLFKFRRIEFPQWSYLFCGREMWLPVKKSAILDQFTIRNVLYLKDPKIAFRDGYRLEA